MHIAFGIREWIVQFSSDFFRIKNSEIRLSRYSKIRFSIPWSSGTSRIMGRVGSLFVPTYSVCACYVRPCTRICTRNSQELAALQIGDVTDPDFGVGGARLEFRSVWSGSRLISPLVMAHNAVPIALRSRCIDWSDWSGPYIYRTYSRCICRHPREYTHARARTRTRISKLPDRTVRGGSIRGEAASTSAWRGSFQSRQIRSSLHHFIKTIRRRDAPGENAGSRDFRYAGLATWLADFRSPKRTIQWTSSVSSRGDAERKKVQTAIAYR